MPAELRKLVNIIDDCDGDCSSCQFANMKHCQAAYCLNAMYEGGFVKDTVDDNTKEWLRRRA